MSPAQIFASKAIITNYWAQSKNGIEPVLKEIIKNLNRDVLYLDIGTNVGLFALVAADRSGARVVAFEPVPSTYVDFVENVEINPHLDVTPFNLCLSSESCMIQIVSERASGINHVIPNVSSDQRGEPHTRQVPAITLDRWAELFMTDMPNRVVMKIDVERHETSVLRGADAFLQMPIPMMICVEIATSEDKKEVVEILTDAGFRYHVPDGWDEHHAQTTDFFFINDLWSDKISNY